MVGGSYFSYGCRRYFCFFAPEYKVASASIFFATALMLLVLSFQTNFRDSGQITNDFFQHSPFRGFSLNRGSFHRRDVSRAVRILSSGPTS